MEDIYPEGGRVGLERDGSVQRLEGVRELEGELGLLGKVFEFAQGVGRGG